jgi:hypothetical protein
MNSNDYHEGNSEPRKAAESAFVVFVGAPDIKLEQLKKI